MRTDRFDLRALYETSRLLSASLDLEFVLGNLLLTAMSKLLVTRGAAFLYDPLEGGYRAASVKGLPALEKGALLKLGTVPGGRMLQDGALPQGLAAHRIELALPVAYGHREIGLIALGKKATGQPFETAELEFIQSLVNMSAAAVHNSLVVEELQQANRDLDAKVQQLNTLFDLSQEFNATVDRERLVKLLSFALMGQMLVSKYLFLLRRPSEANGGDFRVVTHRGVGQAAFGKPLLDALCRQKTLVLLDDAAEIAGDGALDGALDGAERDARWVELHERGLSFLLPLLQQGEPCGVLCLGPKMTGQAYTPDDLEFLGALGNLALVSIQNSYLVDEQIEKERLEEEMRLARDIQERLLPQKHPKIPGATLATLAIPSRFVGGDYFHVSGLERGRFLTAIADVTGKGVPAALLMANLQACLQILHPMPLTLDEAVTHINRVICDNTGFDKFITFFVGIYHPDTRLYEYVNAGHNPPMLVRADGTIEELEAGGLLLGVMRGMPYELGRVTLAPGDTLALFTDGVTEAMSPDDEEYEEHRLERVLRDERTGDAQHVLDAVWTDVRRHTHDAPVLSDDLTMIVLKIDADAASA